MISESGKRLLDMLFEDGEEVSVSHDEYGYKSVPLDNLSYETLELVSPSDKVDTQIVSTSDLKLVAINPICGFRRDENVTSFRNFLVEMDEGTPIDQLRYVKDMGMPYSACVFSGNKSLHFAICLSEALPSYDIYYYLSNWILNVMSKADQNTKNPSRSIRLAGAIRGRTEQKLIDLRSKVSLDDLKAWLSKYPAYAPKIHKNKEQQVPQDLDRIRLVPGWVISKLKFGIDREAGRNVEWFKMASEFGKLGFSDEETVEFFDQFFVSEYDFKRSEWITAIRSGLKNGRKQVGLE